MLYTGLDIHKKTIYETMVDEQGKVVDQRNFAVRKRVLLLSQILYVI